MFVTSFSDLQMKTRISFSFLLVILIGVVAGSQELKCEYRRGISYTCEVTGAKVASRHEIITFRGTHLDKFSNPDVHMIRFEMSVIRSLPLEMFNYFKYLETVLVDHCGLMEFTKTDFRNATNLKIFYARGNYLRELEAFAFEFAINLRSLILSSNYIKYVDEEAFHGLSLLEKLDLTQNYIKALATGTFSDLHNLKILYMNFNKIEKLEKDLFKNNTELVAVYFNNNNISLIDLNLFDEFKDLKKIELNDNPCIFDSIYYETITVKSLHDKLSECQPKPVTEIPQINYCEELEARDLNISEVCLLEVYGNLTNFRLEYENVYEKFRLLNDKYTNMTISLHLARRDAEECHGRFIYLVFSHIGAFLVGILLCSVACYCLIRNRYEDSDDESETPSPKKTSGVTHY